MLHVKSISEYLFESDGENYKFSELSRDSQEKAIDDHRDINVDFDGWHDPVIEGFEEELRDLGFEDIEISYSGFHSQGDGASFTGKISGDEGIKKLLEESGVSDDEYFSYGYEKDSDLLSTLIDIGAEEEVAKIKPEDIHISVDRTDHRHVHSRSVSVNIDIDYPEEWDYEKELEADRSFLPKLESNVTDWVIDKCDEIYRALYKEYESLTSDEAIRDYLEDSDLLFNSDGDII